MISPGSSTGVTHLSLDAGTGMCLSVFRDVRRRSRFHFESNPTPSTASGRLTFSFNFSDQSNTMSQLVLLFLLLFPAIVGAADNASQSNSTKRSPIEVFGSSENPAQRFLDNLTDTNDANQNKAASSPPSTSVRSFGSRFLQDLFGWDLASKTPDQESSEPLNDVVPKPLADEDPIIADTTLTDSALHTHEDSFDDIPTTDDDLLVDEIEQIDSDPIPIDIPSSISSTSVDPEDDMDDAISSKGSNANPTESSTSEADPSAATPRLVIVLNFDNVDAPGKNVLSMLKGIMSPRQKPQGAIKNAPRTKNKSNHTKNNVDNGAADKPTNSNTDKGSDKSSAKGPVITRNGASDTGNQSLASSASNDASSPGSAIDGKHRITSSNKKDNANQMNAPDSTASGGTASGGNDTNDGNAKDKASGQNSKPTKLLIRAKPAHASSTGRSEPPTIEVEITFDGGDAGPAAVAQVLKGMLQ